jgi:hypothetical protein
MGKVINIPIGSLGPFIAFEPPLQKLQRVSLRKTLVSDLGQKLCFHPWDIRGGGIPRCNYMPQVQWNQRFLDLSLILHFMANWNSLLRAI